jgi:hypothetical protein
MPDECLEQARDAERAGDRYYAAMTAWLTRRKRSEEQRRQASALAHVYNRTLDLLIGCLGRIRDRADARRKLREAVKLQSHLKTDLESLGSPGGLTSQGDEI